MIRRVMVLPINADHPQLGMLSAFRSFFPGVEEFDFLSMERKGVPHKIINEALLARAQAFKPDWIFCQLQETGVIEPETLERLTRLAIVTHWTGDLRREISPYMAGTCRSTHLTFASSKGQLAAFRAEGAPRAEYLQIGLDVQEDLLGFPEWEPSFRVPDVVFCGSNYGSIFPGTQQREEAVRALHLAGIDVGVVGNGWPKGYPIVGRCGVKEQHHVWRRAKVALNINNFNDVDGYYSDRQLISMASGTPVVCFEIPGLKDEFVDGEHCLMYRDTDTLIRRVSSLLRDDKLRQTIGRQGRQIVMREHTWNNRIAQALAIVEGLR